MRICDKRMLELKDILKSMGIITFDIDFCEAVGIRKQNLYLIENPIPERKPNHFTVEHILNAAKAFHIDTNFIFGLSSEPFRTRRKKKFGEATPRATLNQKGNTPTINNIL